MALAEEGGKTRGPQAPVTECAIAAHAAKAPASSGCTVPLTCRPLHPLVAQAAVMGAVAAGARGHAARQQQQRKHRQHGLGERSRPHPCAFLSTDESGPGWHVCPASSGVHCRIGQQHAARRHCLRVQRRDGTAAAGQSHAPPPWPLSPFRPSGAPPSGGEDPPSGFRPALGLPLQALVPTLKQRGLCEHTCVRVRAVLACVGVWKDETGAETLDGFWPRLLGSLPLCPSRRCVAAAPRTASIEPAPPAGL